MMNNLICPNCQQGNSEITSGAIGEDFILLECPDCHIEWRICDENPGGARIYWYVNRWYDEAGAVHHFGIQTTDNSLRAANRRVEFHALAVPVSLVYGPATDAEMMEFLADVGLGLDDDADGDMGSLSWLT